MAWLHNIHAALAILAFVIFALSPYLAKQNRQQNNNTDPCAAQDVASPSLGDSLFLLESIVKGEPLQFRRSAVPERGPVNVSFFRHLLSPCGHCLQTPAHKWHQRDDER